MTSLQKKTEGKKHFYVWTLSVIKIIFDDGVDDAF